MDAFLPAMVVIAGWPDECRLLQLLMLLRVCASVVVFASTLFLERVEDGCHLVLLCILWTHVDPYNERRSRSGG